jgi:hypothetical protein
MFVPISRSVLVAVMAWGAVVSTARVDATEAFANLIWSGTRYGNESGKQVSSISQFSDVRPADWAYQALSQLVGRYGCVAGYAHGTFEGKRSLSRFEAAALLNSCLDRISETTAESKKLIKEFERELAVIKGKIDGLEARLAEFSNSQFATTTKLRG